MIHVVEFEASDKVLGVYIVKLRPCVLQRLWATQNIEGFGLQALYL